ncbi:MAG TPA: protease pro-enzyme activation domain-containing protein [Bryobacteraceae bacterium]|jgi:kumamolisin|nr:protease pro-enzyme activation domain-containing protein [Bryobacteraceae bacterium]
MDRTALPGSTAVQTGDRRESAADPAARMRATIVLRPHDPGVAAALLSGKFDSATHSVSGAGETAMLAVEAFARANGLSIEESDPAKRMVVVTGSVSQMSQAFGVIFGQFVSPEGVSYLSYEGKITLPSEIAGHVIAVLGLDTRPAARPRDTER